MAVTANVSLAVQPTKPASAPIQWLHQRCKEHIERPERATQPASQAVTAVAIAGG